MIFSIKCDNYLQTMINNRFNCILDSPLSSKLTYHCHLLYRNVFWMGEGQGIVASPKIKSIFICILNHQSRSLKQALIYNSMKKYTYFESSSSLSQLEARLDKNSYLSKGSLPNSSDAKVFLLFQRLKKIPKRTTHPNLYHWYILMRQFSTRTIQIWQQQVVGCDQDKFINEYVMNQTQSAEKENNLAANNQNKESNTQIMNYKNISSVSTPKNTNKNFKMEDFNENATNRHNLAASSLKYIPNELPQAGNLFRSEMGSPAFQIQYIMQMQLKQNSKRVHGLRQRLEQYRLQLISLQQDQGSIRVVFRTQAQQCERLKDKISQWEQISNLRFRKEKRFNLKSENKSQRIIMSNDLGIATTN